MKYTKHDVQCSPLITSPSIIHHKYQERRRQRKKLEGQYLTPVKDVPSYSLDSSVETVPIKKSKDEEEKDMPLPVILMYGLINTTIVLPIMISFGRIIYKNAAFLPYLPALLNLVTVSGVVHQISFSIFSSLPFAIGQVQDAGLIFLSGMANQMVGYCRTNYKEECTDDVMLSTVVTGLALATFLLGLALIVIGQLRLAEYVQKLPTSVVGGYLAYIGFFCGIAGFDMSYPPHDNNAEDELTSKDILLMSIALSAAFLLFALTRIIRHMAVLPCLLTLYLVSFYVSLHLTNTSVEDAREAGWINKAEPVSSFVDAFKLFDFEKVIWAIYLPNIPQLLAMIFVVALSSSLDVAAIELELKRRLDYNHELKTVGKSNALSGLLGGYTGSYIFSQSIFSLRAGVRSRLSGLFVAALEAFYVVVPFPVLSYIPNFFFSALLIMIAFDLMVEWMWEIRSRVTNAEYCVVLSTFGLINATNVEAGIILGLGVHIVCLFMGFDMGHHEESSFDAMITESDSKSSLGSLGVLPTIVSVGNLEYGSLDDQADDNEGGNHEKEYFNKNGSTSLERGLSF